MTRGTDEAGCAPAAVRHPLGRRRAAVAVAARLTAAVLGGYVLANLAAIAIGFALPIARVDATSAGFLLAFAVHAAAVVGCFAASTPGRAWLGLVAAAGSCLAVIGAAGLAGGG